MINYKKKEAENNQLGRHNLNPDQFRLLLRQRYKLEKIEPGIKQKMLNGEAPAVHAP